MKKILALFSEKSQRSLLLTVLIGIAFYALLTHVSSIYGAAKSLLDVISPLLFGAFLAYLLDPLVRRLENVLGPAMRSKRKGRVYGVIIVYLFVLSLISLLTMMVVPQVVMSMSGLVDSLSAYYGDFEILLRNITADLPFLDIDYDVILSRLGEIASELADVVAQNIDRVFETSVRAGSTLFNLFISVVMSLYILLDKEHVLRTGRRLIRSRMDAEPYAKTVELGAQVDLIFIRFLGGNIIDCLIIGIANFIVLSFLDIPYAVLISTIAGVTNFVPTFGPLVGTIICSLILVIIDPFYAFEFLVLTAILQTLDAYVIKPLLFGDLTGLRPIWVLVAVVVGGGVFGVWGMILGIPITAVLSNLLNSKIDKKLEAHGAAGDEAFTATATKKPKSKRKLKEKQSKP